MKKTLFTLGCAFLCLTAGAQGMLDAINYGRTNYYGTAYTMAIGNATTAVGSDIGSIEINPAGAAVAGYSQVSFTPGVSIASTAASYAPAYEYGSQPVFGSASTASSTKFVVPSGGFTIVIPMYNSGLKSFTLGVVSNITNNYLEDHKTSGTTGCTSITGAFSLAANQAGMPGDIIDQSSPYASSYSWNSITSYFAKMINYDSDGEYYFGSAEGEGIVGGNLNQTSGTTRSGTINDILINFSGNVDDRFYFGVNLGIPNGTYRSTEYFSETPVNSSEFPVTPMDYKTTEDDTYYTGCTYNYKLISSLTGVYGKLGFLVLPTDWLRVGIAAKTPTGYTVRERWQVSCATTFKNTKSNADYYSPEGSYAYKYRSPYEINVGLAATIGGIATISADYEMTDYSIMKFSNGSSFNDPFTQANTLMKKFCGVSHSVRAGLEFNIEKVIFLRAGYGLITDPERTLWDTEKQTSVTAAQYANNWSYYEGRTLEKGSYFSNLVTSYSAGIGFRSRGAFFADLAVRMTQSKSSYQPFNDYFSTEYYYPGNMVSPTVTTTRRLWDIALTIGFRF